MTFSSVIQMCHGGFFHNYLLRWLKDGGMELVLNNL